ncbi:hypothetical protein HG1285_04958 [Hydrogenivirga sp. 128-5-R1-1]|nr:hypothetical protein HG1285_04958 [Hydrogenivirga sp. 128-5-R1-1]
MSDTAVDLQKIIMNIGKEAGTLVSSGLKKSKIDISENNVRISVPELIYDTIIEKKNTIEKHFQKPVEIVKIDTPQKTTKKKKERDPAVDKVLQLFEGKIINYKEE